MQERAKRGAIRVLVIHNHDIFRTGLAALLDERSDIDVIAQASGGRVGVLLADQLRPDVLLIDVRLPDIDAPQAIREILERHPSIRVVALSSAATEAEVASIVEAGTSGLVAERTPVEGVVAAVQAAAHGAAWLSAPAAEILLRRIGRRGETREVSGARLDQLSLRELTVLRLITQGMTNSEIAGKLRISPATVKRHVSSILGKLGLPSRVHAAVYAAQRDVA